MLFRNLSLQLLKFRHLFFHYFFFGNHIFPGLCIFVIHFDIIVRYHAKIIGIVQKRAVTGTAEKNLKECFPRRLVRNLEPFHHRIILFFLNAFRFFDFRKCLLDFRFLFFNLFFHIGKIVGGNRKLVIQIIQFYLQITLLFGQIVEMVFLFLFCLFRFLLLLFRLFLLFLGLLQFLKYIRRGGFDVERWQCGNQNDHRHKHGNPFKDFLHTRCMSPYTLSLISRPVLSYFTQATPAASNILLLAMLPGVPSYLSLS